jgi:hypothetical protein
MHKALRKLGLCLLPLAVTPLLGFLIAEDYLNFGGGDKDIVLLIPWLLWSVLYGVAFVVCWIKNLPLKRAVLYSTSSATVFLLLTWVVLLVWFWRIPGVS